MSENQYTTDYTYTHILTRLRGLQHELGRPPTTRDADEDETLPALDTIYRIAEKGWNRILDDAGIETTQAECYTEEDHDRMVADLQRVFSTQNVDYLTSRIYNDEGRYATSTIKSHFGSWSEACAEANVPSGSKHGQRCLGPTGENLDSRHEQQIAFLLHSFDIDYEVHKPIPDTDWKSDFYLPRFEIWIEVDGYSEGERPNAESFEEKLSFYESSDREYIVTTNPSDLKNRLFT